VTRNAVGAVIADSFGRVLLDKQVAPQLFAVGDCAVRQDDVHGWIPGGHWNTALSDPERVAAAILDDQAAPPSVAPYVFSTQFGKDLSFFGDLPHEPYDVVFRDYSPQSWTALYLLREPAERGKDSPVAVTEQRAVAAVLTVNAPRDASQARKLLARGAFVVATDNLSDLAKQLKQL
jgi:3-phenylpropionate/trans-cinnamate dioxygenase ferredoxin reductase subunit